MSSGVSPIYKSVNRTPLKNRPPRKTRKPKMIRRELIDKSFHDANGKGVSRFYRDYLKFRPTV